MIYQDLVDFKFKYDGNSTLILNEFKIKAKHKLLVAYKEDSKLFATIENLLTKHKFISLILIERLKYNKSAVAAKLVTLFKR